jgi:tRNA1Val (adenine37-N6)-methyltransferase
MEEKTPCTTSAQRNEKPAYRIEGVGKGKAPAAGANPETYTKEYLFKGTLTVKQPAEGYRYSLDSILLADFVSPGRNQRVLDLGAGCGIVSLMLARRYPDLMIYGVEIQPVLAKVAHANVSENKMAERVKIFCADMKDLKPGDMGGAVDIVATNPPYRETGGGRTGPDRMKTAAMHEVFADLSDVVEASARVLKVSGTLVAIYPAQRLSDLFFLLRKAKIEPKTLKTVHPTEKAEANRVLVRAVKYGRPGLTVEAPLLVHRPDGSYTDEVAGMFRLVPGRNDGS